MRLQRYGENQRQISIHLHQIPDTIQTPDRVVLIWVKLYLLGKVKP
jgi:hypothetical protein